VQLRQSSWRFWTRAAAVAAAVLLALHVAARTALATAVTLAPNAWSAPEQTPIPQELAGRRLRVLTTRVGPPTAALASWVIEPASGATRGTILMMHGVRMGKESLVPVGIALSDAGYRAVLVDLRGHGASSGRYLTYGAVEAGDAMLVLDAVALTGEPLGCVGAYGFSYGASVALELGARDPRVKAVVAVSAFSSLREVFGDYRRKYLPSPLRLIPDAWFDAAIDDASRMASFDPDASAPLLAVRRSAASMLLIHGTADNQVPERHSRALVVAAGSRGTLVSVGGAGHDGMAVDATGVVRRQTLAWFERTFESAPCSTWTRSAPGP
jgi:dipeptidyl aminopeptidase/acylaminoacyl peptidase